MSKIFYLLNLFALIISEEINQWNYTENDLFYTTGGISTSLTSISFPSTSYYLFLYKTEEGEYIYSTEFRQMWDSINVTLSPTPIYLDNDKFIILTENDKKFYYYIRESNENKFIPYEIKEDTNIKRI